MTSDDLQALAAQVVDMTVMNRAQATVTVNGQPDPVKSAEARDRMRSEQIALYSKHFTTEQLAAIVQFYSTEIGRSILASHARLAGEMHTGIRIESGSFPESGNKQDQ